MATISVSVPQELKDEFNATFDGRNKSAVIAALMREAIEREQCRLSRVKAIDRILARQAEAPRIGSARLSATRRKGRP